MSSCRACGRPDWCEACSSGHPPPEKVAADQAERVSREAKLVESVRSWLVEIPALMLEVQNYRTPGSAPPDPNARRSSGVGAAMPIVPEVEDLLDTRSKEICDPEDLLLAGYGRLGVLPTLGMWVSLVHAELEDLGRPPRLCCAHRDHTVAGEVGWLHEFCPEAIELHPDFPQAMKRIRQDLRSACRVADPYEPHCPQCGWRVEGVFSEAEKGAEDHIGPAWYRCTGCPKTWQHEAEIKRLALTQPPMTLKHIGVFLDLPWRDLYRWQKEGRFVSVAVNGRGGKLFEVEHVRRAAQRVKRATRKALRRGA